MLTPNQEKYLQTIPDDKVANIKPFDYKAKETGLEIVGQIRTKIPSMEVHFGGSSALGIAGQNDIDLNALSSPEEYHKYLPSLIELFGEPVKKNPNLIKWEFQKNNFDVELYLTDRNSPQLQEQIKTFEILKGSQDYRKEFEQIKLSLNGKSFKEYMRQKYEFFNKLLSHSFNQRFLNRL